MDKWQIVGSIFTPQKISFVFSHYFDVKMHGFSFVLIFSKYNFQWLLPTWLFSNIFMC